MNYPRITCKLCGERDEACFSEPTQSDMIERQLCFTCLKWTNMVEDADPNDIFIDGTAYHIGQESAIGMRGFGGRPHTIQRKGQEIIHTTNLWYIGTIPPLFKSKFPNNAVFVGI